MGETVTFFVKAFEELVTRLLICIYYIIFKLVQGCLCPQAEKCNARVTVQGTTNVMLAAGLGIVPRYALLMADAYICRAGIYFIVADIGLQGLPAWRADKSSSRLMNTPQRLHTRKLLLQG